MTPTQLIFTASILAVILGALMLKQSTRSTFGMECKKGYRVDNNRIGYALVGVALFGAGVAGFVISQII